MIINNTCRFIFVHIPKAAGSSLTNYLSKLSRYCDLEVGATALGEALQPEFRRRFGLSKHSSAMHIRAKVGEDIWQKYFTFGFVRNPYERTFSAFQFMKRMSERRIEAYAQIKQYDTFAEFVRSDFYQTEGPDGILNPQLSWLRKSAVGDDIGVDFVGHVEEMNTCVHELAKKITHGTEGFSWEDVPRLNTSSDDKVTVWDEIRLHPELQEIIYARNKMDFRVFGYERDVMNQKKKP